MNALNTLSDEDQLERERKWTNCILAVVFGIATVALLICGGLFFMLAMESVESTPDEAERWFNTVVQADSVLFSNIQHYESTKASTFLITFDLNSPILMTSRWHYPPSRTNAQSTRDTSGIGKPTSIGTVRPRFRWML